MNTWHNLHLVNKNIIIHWTSIISSFRMLAFVRKINKQHLHIAGTIITAVMILNLVTRLYLDIRRWRGANSRSTFSQADAKIGQFIARRRNRIFVTNEVPTNINLAGFNVYGHYRIFFHRNICNKIWNDRKHLFFISIFRFLCVLTQSRRRYSGHQDTPNTGYYKENRAHQRHTGI